MSDKILKLEQAQTLYQDLRTRVDAIPPIDNSLSDSSTNSVQNKVINEELKKKVNLISNTISGNPCTFNSTIGDIPLKSIKINWTPVQAGTGDPSPSNVRSISGMSGLTVWRTGKNVWDEQTEAGTIDTNTGADASATQWAKLRSKGYITVKPNTRYFFVNGGNGNIWALFYDANKSIIKNYTNPDELPRSYYAYTVTNVSVITPENCRYVRFYLTATYGDTYGNDISVNYPDTNTSYVPYVGTTIPVTFPALGKNLFDKTNSVLNGYITTDGKYNTSNNGEKSVVSGFMKAGTYTISKISTTRYRVGVFDTPSPASLAVPYEFYQASPATNTSLTFTTTHDGYFVIFLYNNTGETTNVQDVVDSVQIEKGSFATAYEPYTNTCYGGSLDLTTGVLTVEWIAYVFDGNEDWKINPNGTTLDNYYYYINLNNDFVVGTCICSHEKQERLSVSNTTIGCNITNVYEIMSFLIRLPSSVVVQNNTAAIKAWIAGQKTNGTPLTAVGKLTTPYEVQLTPQQITTLLGDNVIWSDTNGSIEVELLIGLQEIKDYIDRQNENNVHDIQANGTSVVSNGIANIPYATTGQYGVTKAQLAFGTNVDSISHTLTIYRADESLIKTGTHLYRPIVPVNQHQSVYYALAKLAGADMASVTGETIGVYPEVQKAAIQNMLGITDLISTEESFTATAAHAINSTFLMGGKLYRATAAIAIGDAVVVGTNCEVVKADEIFIKNTDYAKINSFGVVKFLEGNGILVTNGIPYIVKATDAQIQAGSFSYGAIVPNNQHTSIYYGLSKLAGIDLASETVTVGTYPETSKTAIQNMLGVPSTAIATSSTSGLMSAADKSKLDGIATSANNYTLPVMSSTTLGGAYIDDTISSITIWHNPSNNKDILTLNAANSADIKSGSSINKPPTVFRQHESTFYGLAKAAGDSTQASSSNSVGTYTDDAKLAIQTMLGVNGKLNVSEKGVANGVAELDSTGKVPSSQLPSYVDDVLEYASQGAFPTAGESGKIYIAQDTNKTYRWSGSAYAEISESLALGETSSTAYRGDRGAAAYAAAVTNVETTPTSTSGNLITSGGVYTALGDYAQKANPVFTGSISLGRKENTNIGMNSVAIGLEAEANNPFSIALGMNSTSSSISSLAIGIRVTASGSSSIALGMENIASAPNAHVEGLYNIAAGGQSFVYGMYNVADSYDNWDLWQANTSYSVGDKVKRLVDTDSYQGYVCKTSNSDSSFDSNKWDSMNRRMNYAQIIGNGTASQRSNAYAITWNGDGRYAGNVYVGCNSDSTGGTRLPHDIQINGTSIVNNGIANIPIASQSNFGVVKIDDSKGIGVTSQGALAVYPATQYYAKQGTNLYLALNPSIQHVSTFYGLSKVAGVDLANEEVTLGTYPETSKIAIRTMIGAGTPVDVQINNISIISNGVANIPIATSSSVGVVKISSTFGINIYGPETPFAGTLYISGASQNEIKAGNINTKMISAFYTDYCTFYGLAKAAGDTSQAASDNAVGTYTDTAKAAIQTMFGAQAAVEVIRL